MRSSVAQRVDNGFSYTTKWADLLPEGIAASETDSSSEEERPLPARGRSGGGAAVRGDGDFELPSDASEEEEADADDEAAFNQMEATDDEGSSVGSEPEPEGELAPARGRSRSRVKAAPARSGDGGGPDSAAAASRSTVSRSRNRSTSARQPAAAAAGAGPAPAGGAVTATLIACKSPGCTATGTLEEMMLHFGLTHKPLLTPAQLKVTCDVCCREMTEENARKNLAAHKASHSGGDNLLCPYLPPRGTCKHTTPFTRLSSLNEHVAKQHEGTAARVPCEWPGCDKGFTDRARMRRHYDSAHRGVTYTCDFPGCGKTFTRKDHAMTHKKTHEK
jgi:hypothetical protein